MAEQNPINFTPTTTGIGQGAAQVVNVQIKDLDYGSIQRGASAIGTAVAQTAQAEKAKMQEKLSTINSYVDDVEVYFPQSQAKVDESIDKFYEKGDISDSAFLNLKRELKTIQQTDVLIKDQAAAARDGKGIYKDAHRFNEETLEYESPQTQFDAMLNTEIDPNQSVTGWQQNLIGTLTPNVGEDFIYAQDITEEDIKGALVEEINNIYELRGSEEVIDIKKQDGRIVTETFAGISDEDFQQALENIKGNDAYKNAYVATSVYNDGNSPSALKDENALEIYTNQYNDFIDTLGKSYRPGKTDVATTQAPAPKEEKADVKISLEAEGAFDITGTGADAVVSTSGSYTEGAKEISGVKVYKVVGTSGVEIPVLDSNGKPSYEEKEIGGVETRVPITQVVQDQELHDAYIRMVGKTQKKVDEINKQLTESQQSVPVKDVRKKLIQDFTSKAGTALDWLGGIEWDNNEDLINLLQSNGYEVSSSLKKKIEGANFSERESVAPVVDLLIKENPGLVFKLGSEKKETVAKKMRDPAKQSLADKMKNSGQNSTGQKEEVQPVQTTTADAPKTPVKETPQAVEQPPFQYSAEIKTGANGTTKTLNKDQQENFDAVIAEPDFTEANMMFEDNFGRVTNSKLVGTPQNKDVLNDYFYGKGSMGLGNYSRTNKEKVGTAAIFPDADQKSPQYEMLAMFNMNTSWHPKVLAGVASGKIKRSERGKYWADFDNEKLTGIDIEAIDPQTLLNEMDNIYRNTYSSSEKSTGGYLPEQYASYRKRIEWLANRYGLETPTL